MAGVDGLWIASGLAHGQGRPWAYDHIVSDQPADDPGDQPSPEPTPPVEAVPAAVTTAPRAKTFRRTMLSTGFSDVPGKTCAVCGFEGFRWQAACPNGHPLG